MPTAKGFDGSATKHRFVGINMDAEKARMEGHLDISTAFCGWARCCTFDLSHCLMQGIGGMPTKMQHVTVPRLNMSGDLSQTATLEEFSEELAQDQIRAVRVDEMEYAIEGAWWLCLVCGRSIQTSEQQAHSTDLFEAGWWIIEIEWYEHEHDERKYRLKQGSKRWLAVNAIIRVGGLEFEGGTRLAHSGVRVLSKPSHELINEFM